MGENVENTPGRQAIVVMQDIHKDLVFKKPKIPIRRKPKKILDEETYVEEIGKIVQRDFFPDLERLKAQSDYLDAIQKNDISKLRELYAKYSGKKPIERLHSPATFETPNVHNSTPVLESENGENLEKSAKVDKLGKITLDQYLNSRTSEDNESFEDIVEQSVRSHYYKYSYLYNEEENTTDEKNKQLALPSIEQQCALPEKKLNLDTWTYKNHNSLMFIPNGVPLTKEQEIEILAKKQEIIHKNTRLNTNPFNDTHSKETISELAKTQAKILDGKIGVDGKELRGNTPTFGGWGLVRTPSPAPGNMGSPLMTWGEIEGTPFRLDGGDTPLPRSHGPSFKIAEPREREMLAHSLAEKVGEKYNQKKKRAIDTARKFTAPSPKLNERLATMSPAARRLATSSFKCGVSSSLKRVATSPRFLNRSKTPKTPRNLVSTPKIRPNTSKNEQPKQSGITLTDDLLKINVPRRFTAKDFF